MTLSIKHCLTLAKEKLSAKSSTPYLDGEVILSFVLNCQRSVLHAYPEKIVTKDEAQQFLKAINLRESGMPVAYIIGKQSFWNLELTVNQHTLIPRPETEIIIEQVLALLPENNHKIVVDLGTGSGAIALALASEKSSWTILALDSSFDALAIAQKNRNHYQFYNVHFLLQDWFSAFAEKNFIDLIVSNPPYLAEDDPHLQTLSYEPSQAFIAGNDGLFCYRQIIDQANKYLKDDGTLILEHGIDQEVQIKHLFEQAQFEVVKEIPDYANINRVSIAKKSK